MKHDKSEVNQVCSLWFLKRDGIKHLDHVLLAPQLIRLGDVTHGAWSGYVVKDCAQRHIRMCLLILF